MAPRPDDAAIQPINADSTQQVGRPTTPGGISARSDWPFFLSPIHGINYRTLPLQDVSVGRQRTLRSFYVDVDVEVTVSLLAALNY